MKKEAGKRRRRRKSVKKGIRTVREEQRGGKTQEIKINDLIKS